MKTVLGFLLLLFCVSTASSQVWPTDWTWGARHIKADSLHAGRVKVDTTLVVDSIYARAYGGTVPGGSSFEWSVQGNAHVFDSLRFIPSTGISLIQSDYTITITGTDTTSLSNRINGKQPSGTYLLPADTNYIHAHLGGSAIDTTSLSNRIDAKQDAGTYIIPSDTTILHNEIASKQPAGTYLVPSDSTSIRNYSGSLYQPKGTYLTPTDTNTISAEIKRKIDTTAAVTVDTTGFAAKTDTTGHLGVSLGTVKWYSEPVRRIFGTGGVMDSIKTTDTVALGRIYPGAVLLSIIYDGARGQYLKVKLEMVDSLFQTAAGTLIDTMTTITQVATRASVCAGGTFTLTTGKMVRMVVISVGVMPKEFVVTGVGKNL